MKTWILVYKPLYLLWNTPFFLQRKYFLVQILHWKIANIGWICQISKKALLMHFDIRKKYLKQMLFFLSCFTSVAFHKLRWQIDGHCRGGVVFIEYYHKGDISLMGQIASQQIPIFNKIVYGRSHILKYVMGVF